MYTRIELITPERAKQMLEKNTENRRLRELKVQQFASIIRNGQFRTTHNGIAFRPDGVLGDGQHRLAGIVAANIAVKMMVTYDMPKDDFRAVDIFHTPRSIADLLSIKNGRAATVSNFLYRASCANQRDARLTPDRVEPFWQTFGNATETLLQECSADRRKLSAAPVRAAAVICMMDRDPLFATNTYRSIVLTKTEELKPSGHAYFQWLLAQRNLCAVVQWEAFCRGLQAFDEEHAHLKKLIIRDLAAAMERGRTRIETIVAREQRWRERHAETAVAAE